MSEDHSTVPDGTMLSEELVAAFLRANLDFFAKHPDLVRDMHIPHNCGGAVSLVERQTELLRGRVSELDSKLAGFVEAAKENEILLERQHRLILSLLHSDDINDAVQLLHDQLREDFGVDFARTVVFDDRNECMSNGLCFYDREYLKQNGLLSFFERKKPMFGKLTGQYMTVLFGEDAPAVASAAVIDVSAEEPFGLLLLGSADPDRFTPAMGGELMARLGEVLGGIFVRRVDRDSAA